MTEPSAQPGPRTFSHLRRWVVTPTVLALLIARAPGQSSTSTFAALKQLSVEQLMDIEVTSVSKRPEKLSETASAIQVITGEEIHRSGATSLPEALRLAPNLQVAQLNSYSWVIGARGFNGNFANKLLVMIDGRSVYTPLFAGVLWDAQTPFLADVDRIEVVSGPGGTLWGANAVNGVINLITKSAKETQDGYVEAAAGSTVENSAAVRYGGQAGKDLFFRIYAEHFERDRTTLPTGKGAADAWDMTQGGFRLDYAPSTAGALTLQGDFYGGAQQTSPTDSRERGENVLGRWTRTLAPQSELRVQAYYDHTWLRDTPSTITDDLTTFDFDLQHGFPAGERQSILWGVDCRLMQDEAQTSTAFVGLLPPHRDMQLFSGFVQDEIALFPARLKLTLGTKLEHNDFSGLEIQPSVRLAWTPTTSQTIWGAVSRAVRSPSRFDADYYLPKAPPFVIAGGPNFKAEKVVAYELGYRVQPAANLSLSFAAFYNRYEDIYNVQTLTFPYTIENGVEGPSHGGEFSGTWQPAAWWRLRGGYTYFDKKLRAKPGHATTSAILASLGDDPQNQFSLQSMMELGHGLQFDVTARAVSALPDPRVPGYVTCDVRLAWQLPNWEWSIVGQNLGDDQHAEFGTLQQIRRSVYGKVAWRY